MKNISLILLPLFILYGCGNSNDRKSSFTDEARTAYEKAEQSPELVTSIFLGFDFNMSRDDVRNHFSELCRQEKISTGKDAHYTYDFHTPQGTAIATFRTEYYNDTLCCLTLLLQSGDDGILGIIGTPQTTMQSAIDVFEKQADDYHFYIDETLKSATSYQYIKENLVVKFSSFLDAKMSYINAPKYLLLKELNNKEKSDMVDSTLSDF